MNLLYYFFKLSIRLNNPYYREMFAGFNRMKWIYYYYFFKLSIRLNNSYYREMFAEFNRMKCIYYYFFFKLSIRLNNPYYREMFPKFNRTKVALIHKYIHTYIYTYIHTGEANNIKRVIKMKILGHFMLELPRGQRDMISKKRFCPA